MTATVSSTGAATGADLLADALAGAGFDVLFALPGVQLDAAFDALARRRDRIRVIHTRHEQATSYMADGYARATGRPGCCLVVPGPGVLNAAAGLATAYACSSPVLCVTGQIPSRAIDRGHGQLHEIPHQLEMLGSVTKWAARATTADEVPGLVAEAVRRMVADRPRPVAVEIPPDVLEATATGAATGPSPPAAGPGRPPGDVIETADRLLRQARRPLILAGGGVIQDGAWGGLRELAERLAAPVLMTEHGKGALSARHPLAFSGLAARPLLARADVIVAVGTRLVQPGGDRLRLAAGQSLVRIDPDPLELAGGGEPAALVRSTAGPALAALLALVPEESPPRWEGLEEIRTAAAAEAFRLEPQAEYGRVLREELADDAIVVNGMTQLGYWNRLGFPVYEPRTFITAGYQGTLGFELPTGLGAAVGRPDRKVVVVAGDGGFMFNVQELATAVQHRIGVVCLVFNDGGYGNVRREQIRRFGRTIASDLRNPDFLALAAAFGMEAHRAEDPAALRTALRSALAAAGPVLIEAPVGEMDDPWPLILGAGAA